MHTFLHHRRHRFDALHALLTGATESTRKGIPSRLRRDVGLPEDPDPGVLPVFGLGPETARRRG